MAARPDETATHAYAPLRAEWNGIMSTKEQREQQEQSIEFLHEYLSPGQDVYTSVKHVSRSGMSRVISVHIVDSQGEILDISFHVARAIGASFDRDRWGVKMGGTGMDMAFAVVYELGRALYPTGVPCTGSTGRTAGGNRTRNPRCLSNDHVNGDRVYRKGKTHRDGGYAFNKVTL